jgi:hypothetical protein
VKDLPEKTTINREMITEHQHEQEKPPIFNSWKSLYIAVLANLAFLIIVFYIITKVYE